MTSFIQIKSGSRGLESTKWDKWTLAWKFYKSTKLKSVYKELYFSISKFYFVFSPVMCDVPQSIFVFSNILVRHQMVPFSLSLCLPFISPLFTTQQSNYLTLLAKTWHGGNTQRGWIKFKKWCGLSWQKNSGEGSKTSSFSSFNICFLVWNNVCDVDQVLPLLSSISSKVLCRTQHSSQFKFRACNHEIQSSIWTIYAPHPAHNPGFTAIFWFRGLFHVTENSITIWLQSTNYPLFSLEAELMSVQINIFASPWHSALFSVCDPQKKHSNSFPLSIPLSPFSLLCLDYINRCSFLTCSLTFLVIL